MKRHFKPCPHVRGFANPGLAAILGSACALFGATADLRAASATWSGPNSAGVFDTGTNWNTGTAPGFDSGAATGAPATLNNTDTATFSTAVSSLTFIDTRNLQNFAFGQSASFIFGATTGPSLYLTDGGSATATGATVTFAEPAVLQGSYTFSNNRPGTGAIIIGGASNGGAITGAGAGTTLTFNGSSTGMTTVNAAITGSESMVLGGTGAFTFNNTGNSFSGGLSVAAGATVLDGGVGNTSRAFGTGTIALGGNTVILTTNGTGANANTVNNAITTGATANSFLYRLSGSFAPASLTGTGTLNIGLNATALGGLASGATAIAGTSFGAYGGTINVSGVSSTITNTLTLATGALANTTGSLNIQANATVTSASANVNSGSAINLAGGTLTPNGTSVGMLTLTGGKGFSLSAGTLGLTINGTAPGAFDQILASGTSTFSLTGGTLDLGGVTAANGNSYQIFSGFASGSVSGIAFTDFAAGDGSLPSLNSTGMLTFASVPEPSTWIGAALGLGLIAASRVRSFKAWNRAV